MSAPIQDCAPQVGLARADLILDAFDGPGQLTLAQIARRTGVPRSSVHRMLERLVQLGWLIRSGQQYRLGLRLFELGSLAVQQDRLHCVALPHLRELRRVTGHTVHLAVLDGDDVIYLDKLDGRYTMNIDTRPGVRRPAGRTSVGKVLLAHLAGGEPSLRQVSDNHTTTVDGQLRREQAEIRLRGIAFDRQESVPGVGCVGAAVGVKDDVVAAVSVCGPAEVLAMDSRMAGMVRATGVQIYRQLNRRRTAV